MLKRVLKKALKKPKKKPKKRKLKKGQPVGWPMLVADALQPTSPRMSRSVMFKASICSV